MKLKALVLAGMVAISSGFGVLAFSGDSYADVTCPAGSVREGSTAKTYAECNLPEESADDPKLMDTVTTILNVIVGVVGIIAVAVIIIGGIFFVTSTGDAAKTTRARNTILYGLVGLVVALLAFAIVNFVLKSVFDNGGGGTESGQVVNT